MTDIAYLVAAVCFVLALRGLAHPKTAQFALKIGIAGMALAVLTTLSLLKYEALLPIFVVAALGGAVGLTIAAKIPMTALPQLVAAFHSLVGLAATAVATAAFYDPMAYGILNEAGAIKTTSLVEMGLGAAIGAITFTGSVVAFAKLQGIVGGSPVVFKGQHLLNLVFGIAIFVGTAWFAMEGSATMFWFIVLVALVVGVTLIIPIGGADMPVVVSMLNSYSGWAAAGIGFTLGNSLLIIGGSLVGASGAILSYIMCKGMNRSFINVILGGFGADEAGGDSKGAAKPVKQGNAADAAFILQNADSAIIVPGYGMAVAQAQHATAALATALKQQGVKVRFAVHPVAGRMPGHMNVLLAEANVDYEDVLELEEINSDFGSTDVAFVIGANDITNPSAKTDKTSPIYGMPILDVEKAGAVLFVKRSLASGYAGVENPLFFHDNTIMLFGDAKKMSEDILKEIE